MIFIIFQANGGVKQLGLGEFWSVSCCVRREVREKPNNLKLVCLISTWQKSKKAREQKVKTTTTTEVFGGKEKQ